MLTIEQSTSFMIECHCKTVLNSMLIIEQNILLNVNVLDVFLNEAYDLQWIIMNHLIIVLLKL